MVSYPKDQTKCETIVTSWPCECAIRLARDGLRGNAPFTTDEADELARAVLEQHGEIERLHAKIPGAWAALEEARAERDAYCQEFEDMCEQHAVIIPENFKLRGALQRLLGYWDTQHSRRDFAALAMLEEDVENIRALLEEKP